MNSVVCERIGSYEAKTKLPELLRRVEAGECFVITRHGQEVAKLEPVQEKPKLTVEQAIADMREFRKTHTLDGISIRDLINEGRRY